MKFQIDSEFRDLIPPLSIDEFLQLRDSILAEGVRDPLVVWTNNRSKPLLIEGHHRWQIIQEHKIKQFQIIEKLFSDRDEVKSWIIDNQCGRRNLPLFMKCFLQIQKMEFQLKLKAKKNQGRRSDLSPNSAEYSPIHVDEELAKVANVSVQTIQRARYLLKNSNDEILTSLRTGQSSINEAFIECRRNVRDEETRKRQNVSSKIPDDFRLIKGDALSELRKIPSESVDAVITDPPFGVGFTRRGKQIEEHDDAAEYGQWLKPIIDEIERNLRPGGFLAVFQSGVHFRHLWEWFGDDILMGIEKVPEYVILARSRIAEALEQAAIEE